MEAYLHSVDMLPVAVGGLAGHTFPPGDGRFVGGCTGFVRHEKGEHRYVSGCVGRIGQPEFQRFVGGCAGFAGLRAFQVARRSQVHDRAGHEARAKWGDEALEAAPA
jgi:hypothetical protein